MAASSPPSSAKPSRAWIWMGVCAILLAAWLVIRNTSQSPRSSGAPQDAAQQGRSQADTADGATAATKAGSSAARDSESSEEPATTRSSIRRTGPESEESVSQFPQVERILADESLGSPKAAAALLEIAKRAELPEDERYEALAHGLNLDFQAFVPLASDSSLPSTLAQRFLDELANQNQRPILQIEGCLALMEHSDPSIRVQAAERLAFLVKNEALAGSTDELRQTANARILEIKQSN